MPTFAKLAAALALALCSLHPSPTLAQDDPAGSTEQPAAGEDRTGGSDQPADGDDTGVANLELEPLSDQQATSALEQPAPEPPPPPVRTDADGEEPKPLADRVGAALDAGADAWGNLVTGREKYRSGDEDVVSRVVGQNPELFESDRESLAGRLLSGPSQLASGVALADRLRGQFDDDSERALWALDRYRNDLRTAKPAGWEEQDATLSVADKNLAARGGPVSSLVNSALSGPYQDWKRLGLESKDASPPSWAQQYAPYVGTVQYYTNLRGAAANLQEAGGFLWNDAKELVGW